MKDPTRWAVIAWLENLWSNVGGGLLQLLGREQLSQAAPKELHTDLCVGAPARRQQRYQAVPLPQALLAAFAVEPLAAGDTRFIGREAELQRFEAALARFRAGSSAAVAVVGRQGYGTSSFLQQLAQQLGERETFRYGRLVRRPQDVTDTLEILSQLVGCERPIDSLEKLVDYLNELEPQVIAIDDAHLFAGRIIGSQEALRCFGAMLVATQNRHLWVVGFELFAWQRLGYVYSAQRYFEDCIELPPFSEAELGQCLAARISAAGLALDNGADGEPGQLPGLLASMMTDLVKLSEGKPDLAFFYFLDALFVDENSGQLSAGPVIPMDFGSLKKLVHGELFTLAEIAANGQLTIADHRAVFRTSHEESWLLLEHLHHLCLLERSEEGVEVAAYRLMSLYSNVINNFLTNANYLY